MDSRCASMFLVFLVLTPLATGATDPDSGESSDPEVASDAPIPFQMVSTEEGVSLHKDMYLLPLTWSDEYNGPETEVVFQLSAKLRIVRSKFFIGYTQLSLWQAYNRDESSPFRETDYNPEVFYRIGPSNSRLLHWGWDFGYEHQSNGQSKPKSRSWDRLFAAGHYQTGRTLYYLKMWYRVREDECPIGSDGLPEAWCRDDATYDDNPDITDYLGHAEFHLRRRLTAAEKPQELHFMIRGNPRAGNGGFRLDYSYPARTKDLHWFAMLWHGYGESLIDYNQSVTRIGIGLIMRQP